MSYDSLIVLPLSDLGGLVSGASHFVIVDQLRQRAAGQNVIIGVAHPGGHYFAATDGSLWTLQRGIFVKKRPTSFWKGYPRSGSDKHHVIVCESFYGQRPTQEHECRHLNGRRGVCTPKNLSWGTKEENWQDRKSHGRGMEGEKHFNSNWTNKNRAAIRLAHSRKTCSTNEFSKAIGLSQATLRRILNATEIAPPRITIPPNRIPLVAALIENIRDMGGGTYGVSLLLNIDK